MYFAIQRAVSHEPKPQKQKTHFGGYKVTFSINRSSKQIQIQSKMKSFATVLEKFEHLSDI